MNRFISFPLLLATALMLTACLAQPHPNKNRFGLAAEIGPDSAPAKARRTLMLGAAATAAGYDNRALVYKIGPDQYESDFYNEFLAPPARLLVDLVTQYLEAHNAKARVVKSPGLTLADFGLETYLEKLYGDYTVDPPQAVIEVRFTLNDLRGSSGKVLWERTYRRAQPFSGKNPAALVAAFNLGLGGLLDELDHDIEKAIR